MLEFIGGLIPQFLVDFWNTWTPLAQYLATTLFKILIVTVAVILCVAFSTYFERKVIGSMQARVGPNRVGPKGLLQPFADVFKLLFKEVIIPSQSNKFLFVIAPLLSLTPALATWAVIPMNNWFVIADINAGLLYVLALTSVGVYGVILAGWATNSKYALLGAMRSAAQIVAYEIAMGFALVGILMASGSLNIGDIVRAQEGGFSNWFLLPLFPLFLVYWIAGVAETNRAPFDVAEGESEIVAGFHVEYSGVAFALFFLAEYANMILISTLTAVFFLGGWAVHQDVFLHVHLLLAARDVSTLSLRPDHAARLESVHSRNDCLDRCRRRDGVVPGRSVGRAGGVGDEPDHQLHQDLHPLGVAQGTESHADQLVPQKRHARVPGREDPTVASFSRIACPASLPERGRALHRLQTLRGGMPGAGDHDRVRRR